MRLTLAAISLFALCASTSVADASPDLGAPEAAERTAHRVRAYDRYDLPTGVFGNRAVTSETVFGEVTWQAFRLSDPDASTDGVMAGYRSRLAALGFEPVFECHTETCGGFDFRFRAAILPAPAMLLDVADFSQFTAVRDEPASYASVLVSRVRDAVYVQTVSVEPRDPPDAVTPAPEMDTGTEVSFIPAEERELLARLNADGHVPVAGLEFELGGATLSESSKRSLDMLARLLSRDAEIAVYIVGHTDTAGSLEVNLTVSRRRAEAVRAALIARGVPAQQVAAQGVAFLAPVTSNQTEGGRARNRRVELVLRPRP